MATAETTFAGLRVRKQLEAAQGRIRALKRIDLAVGVLIRLGGIGIVVSVLGILVFIFSEAWPLFRGSEGKLLGTVSLPAPAAPPAATTPRAPAPPTAWFPSKLLLVTLVIAPERVAIPPPTPAPARTFSVTPSQHGRPTS